MLRGQKVVFHPIHRPANEFNRQIDELKCIGKQRVHFNRYFKDLYLAKIAGFSIEGQKSRNRTTQY